MSLMKLFSLNCLLCRALFLLCISLLLWSGQSVAQVNLQLSTSAPTAAQLTGDDFRILLQYRAASTNQDANDARLEVRIPSSIEFKSIQNSPHIASSGYDSVAHLAWFEFIDPLAAGTTGEIGLRVGFPNGITPDGEVATFSSTFSAEGARSKTSSASVTAEATSKLNILKYYIGQPSVGNQTVYGFTICNGELGEEEYGSLDLSSLNLADPLPANATFVRFDYDTEGIISASYDNATHTANWVLDGLSSGECRYVKVIVRYDAPANTVGQSVSNTGIATATPVGQSPVTASQTVTHFLEAARNEVTVDKTSAPSILEPNSISTFLISIINTGTEVLDALEITDIIPYETEVFKIYIGRYSDANTTDNAFVTLQYQTNLNSTWQTYAPSPMLAYDGREIRISELGLSLGGPEYLTQVRFQYGDRSNAFHSYEDILLRYRIRRGTLPRTVTNCITPTSLTLGATLNADCADIEVIPGLTGPSVNLRLECYNGCNNPYVVGSEVELEATIINRSESGAAMEDFMGLVHLPQGTSFVPGSSDIKQYGGLVGEPVIENLQDIDGDGASLLRLKWTGADGSLGIGKIMRFTFKVKIEESAPAGFDALQFVVATSSRTDVVECMADDLIDVYDLDGDSDRTEQLCAADMAIDVAEYVAVSSKLSVKGSLDNEYSTFPDQGETLPGGLADYRLTLVNEGNTNLRDFTFINIFPQVGDVGIIDPQARSSAWRPNLIGPVDAPPGVVVYYSTASNPCRAADGFLATDPAGCQAANWTIVPPVDITSVNSIKIEFGELLIAPQDILTFEWPMRTPTDVLTQPGVNPEDVAFNSVGFIATVDGSGSVLLPSEPVKTGLQIKSLVPGVIGDRVWSDTSGDGIQSIGEDGVNNVRVELYEDNGDGLPNTATDTYIGFTSTAGDGNYLFPNLSAGNYFVFFVKLPTYSLADKGQGSDPELDSDGTAYTSNGIAGAISEIINITNTEFNFSTDLGLVPTGRGAIGDYVWEDANANGIQDEGVAVGVNGITVELLSTSGAVLATAQTNTDESGKRGYYVFDDLTPNSYRLRVQTPTGITLSTSGQGGDTNADSDGNPSTGRTNIFSVAANNFVENIDFGLQLPAVEICDNGFDDDGDGLIDCEDQACPGADAVVRITVD
jgi:hypothetical protein